ncbi:MAG: excalibur calcium-binding domain-containing protein, partial [Corynebacterium sp.]|nr:excalibur calcium-binding domain-containing protein [Corynebacterium sp.]
PAPAPAPAPAQQAPKATPTPAPAAAAPARSGAYYPNCRAVWRELGRPIRSHEAGYNRDLDRDGDGVGCEKRPR